MITMIIPVHEEQCKNVLEASIKSFVESDPQPFEIILVSDGEEVELPSCFSSCGITQLSTGKKAGPGVARNLGAANASGDLLLFVDSDIIVSKDIVSQIQSEFDNNPGIDALFGSYDTSPSKPNFLSQYRNLLHHFVHQNGKEQAFTFWSGCGAIRKDAFHAVGGFDGERYPDPSIEDIELGYRLKKEGYSIRLAKQIQVTHLKEWGANSMLTVDFFKRALPWTELLLQNNDVGNDLNVKNTDRASTVSLFLVLIFAISGFLEPLSLLFALFFLVVYFLLNLSIYRFFFRLRGPVFTVKVIPWHILFYFLCGTAFIVGLFKYYLIDNGTSISKQMLTTEPRIMGK